VSLPHFIKDLGLKLAHMGEYPVALRGKKNAVFKTRVLGWVAKKRHPNLHDWNIRNVTLPRIPQSSMRACYLTICF
ncbi:MAG: hypothetical protein WCK96_17045, partial [Methylococcales bacterium]